MRGDLIHANEKMPNGKVNDQTKNVVEGGHKWSCCQSGINLHAVQGQWNPSAEKAGENDHTEQCDTGREAQAEIDLKQQTDEKNDR